MALLNDEDSEKLLQAERAFTNIKTSMEEVGFDQPSPGNYPHQSVLDRSGSEILAYRVGTGDTNQPVRLSYGDGEGSVAFFEWEEGGTEGVLSNQDHNELDQTELVRNYSNDPRMALADADIHSVTDGTAIASFEIEPDAGVETYRSVARTFGEMMEDVRYD